MQEQQEAAGSQSGRNQLPTLAPRHSHTSSSRDRTSGSASSSGRPPRLSHRSRAGCWTCRARKVKCDEVHPKCGPCTRLNRTCDWDHRWNFSDATSNTQSKYSNVTTSGNAVWDPNARNSRDPSPIVRPDDMPAFAVLANDDERERKAETRRPGTFGVVVTPESFADLPEYAGPTSPSSRRGSMQSQASSLFTSNGPFIGKTLSRSQTDPNVVVLDRFEDASPIPTGPWPTPSDSRRPSLPDRIQYLSIATPSLPSSSMVPPSPVLHLAATDDPLISHFRQYLLPRLVQPQADDLSANLLTSQTKDFFELEARVFPPLHQAISALSAMSLSYNGAASLDAAHLHYGQALSPLSAATSAEELLSNGTFLSHFMLFVFDICISMQHDDAATNIWAIHLDHLKRITKLRHEMLGPERHGYLIWAICELDVYACLLGSGDCSFVRAVLQNDMMPAFEQQLPSSAAPMLGGYAANEIQIFPAILGLRQAVLIQMANLAQAAQRFRQQAKATGAVSPGTYASWQATVSQLQAQLAATWAQAYPRFLPPESPHAGRDLPPRPRYVFEQAFLLYQTAIVYSRTSMFYRQRSIPVAQQQEMFADTEGRIMATVSLATSQLESHRLAEHRHVIFPLFIAGFATSQPDVKIQALNIIKAYEGTGIGQNTYTTRQLLSTVYEEQRRAVDEGRRMEDIYWLEVARERSLTIVNCGL